MQDFIIKQSERHGVPLPDKIANPPKLNAGLEFFYLSFQHLLTCRSFNGVIPYLAIEEYMDRHSIYRDQRADVHYHIRNLDNVYSEYQNKKGK